MVLVDTVVAEFVVNESHVDEIHKAYSYIEAAAIDHPLPGDADVVSLDGQNESRPFGVRILDVVVRIQRAEKHGILLDVKGHIVLQVDGSRDIVSLVKHDSSSASGGGEINRGLDAGRVHGHTVRDGSEVTGIEVGGSKSQGRAGE